MPVDNEKNPTAPPFCKQAPCLCSPAEDSESVSDDGRRTESSPRGDPASSLAPASILP
jgi:hypothetical protein